MHEYNGHTEKGQSQGLVPKANYKLKITNMSCDAYFLGHFVHVDIDSESHLTP